MKTAQKGQVVCDKGSKPEGFYFVLQGKVKLAVLSESGTERVVEIIQAGNTFGEALMFLDQPCPVYAQTLDRTELVFFQGKRIRKAIRLWPDFSLAIMGGLSQRVHSLVQDVEACCLQSAPQRVASYLLSHVDGTSDSRQTIEVVLPAGKAVVASSLNLTPETFSRELHQLVQKGLISVDRRTIHIHRLDGLRSACNCH